MTEQQVSRDIAYRRPAAIGVAAHGEQELMLGPRQSGGVGLFLAPSFEAAQPVPEAQQSCVVGVGNPIRHRPYRVTTGCRLDDDAAAHLDADAAGRVVPSSWPTTVRSRVSTRVVREVVDQPRRGAHCHLRKARNTPRAPQIAMTPRLDQAQGEVPGMWLKESCMLTISLRTGR